MKLRNRLALLLAVLITVSSCFTVFVSAEETSKTAPIEPGITSGNAVVAYCIDDKQFLYSKRLDETVAPAVAAKLVAAMVAADILQERGLKSEDVIVTVTQEAVDNSGNIYDVRVPMLGFNKGDTCSAKDILSSMLVANANDAASALACHFGEAFLGGNMATFVERMNKKVADLGLENTKFVNATGLDSAEQYTTPREVALIAAAFYNYNELVTLSDVESFRYKDRTTIRNSNYLKNDHTISGYTNDNAIGIIAGQLNKDGNYCLIAASQKDGRTYIFVIMCASGMIVESSNDKITCSFGVGNAYIDMNLLIDWTREAFTLFTIATTETIIGELRVNLGNSTDHVMIVPAVNVERLVINDELEGVEKRLDYDPELVYKDDFNGSEYDTINAPVTIGQRVGTVTYIHNGVELVTVDAVTKEAIESDSVKATLNTAKNFLFGDVMKTVLYVIVGIIILYIIVVIVMSVIKTVNKFRASARKRKKRKEKAQKTQPKKSEAQQTETKKSELKKTDTIVASDSADNAKKSVGKDSENVDINAITREIT